MKNLILTLSALVLITLSSHAQHDNLQALNDSDPTFGCSYYIVPVAMTGTTEVDVTSLRTLFAPQDQHTFNRTDLTTALGSSYEYIGAKVEGANGPLYVYSNGSSKDLNENDDTGDCGGMNLDVVYDDAYIAGTSELTVTDDQ